VTMQIIIEPWRCRQYVFPKRR